MLATMHRTILFVLPLLLASCNGFNLDEKKDKFSITVHSQGTADDSPRSVFKIPVPGRTQPMIFKLVPEIAQHNIAAFHSFPADDGNGFGITMRLDFRASETLNLISRTKQGEILLAMVNGQPVDVLTIDKPVNDGLYTIWEGVPQTVIDQMAKKYPPISKLKSVSSGQEMLPTTRAEKKHAMKDLNAERKAAIEAEKKKAADPNNTAEPQKPDTTSGFPRSQSKPGKGSPLDGTMLNREAPLVKP